MNYMTNLSDHDALVKWNSGYGRVELPQGDRQSPVLTDILIAHKSKAECFNDNYAIIFIGP